MTNAALKCLIDIKDVMMVLVLYSEELKSNESFKDKWLLKVDRLKGTVEFLSKEEKRELDKEYSMWYSLTLEQLIPETVRAMEPLRWY